MSPATARALAQTLISAADIADAAGHSEIDLVAQLALADDVARDDLQSALDEIAGS